MNIEDFQHFLLFKLHFEVVIFPISFLFSKLNKMFFSSCYPLDGCLTWFPFYCCSSPTHEPVCQSKVLKGGHTTLQKASLVLGTFDWKGFFHTVYIADNISWSDILFFCGFHFCYSQQHYISDSYSICGNYYSQILFCSNAAETMSPRFVFMHSISPFLDEALCFCLHYFILVEIKPSL